MVRQAIACDDPVIFLEPKRRYWDKAEVDLASAALLPMSSARVAKSGRDLTLVSYGPMVRTCLEAAAAADADGVDIEVVDLRSLSPIDFDTIVASVRRTGRCVVAHEASVFLGIAAEVAAAVTEECFYELESPVLRVGGFHTPYPPSRLENHYLPDLDRILEAVDKAMAY
jgi:pyruvate dehydrogenase E1 component beta subunit